MRSSAVSDGLAPLVSIAQSIARVLRGRRAKLVPQSYHARGVGIVDDLNAIPRSPEAIVLEVLTDMVLDELEELNRP